MDLGLFEEILSQLTAPKRLTKLVHLHILGDPLAVKNLDVYLELLGGREPSLLLDKKKSAQATAIVTNPIDGVKQSEKKFREPRIFALSEEDEAKHREFLEKKIKNPIWLAETTEVEKS